MLSLNARQFSTFLQITPMVFHLSHYTIVFQLFTRRAGKSLPVCFISFLTCISLQGSEQKQQLCYNSGMDLQQIEPIVRVLRQRLEPVERANMLADQLEGQQPDARHAAVLIGIFEQDGEASLVFIRRATTLRSHSGEIAFPGGGVEATDQSRVAAALREAREEIGLDPSRIEVLGLLYPVFTVVSNYLITPVVAYLPQGLGSLRLQASEVTEIILASLRGLADPAIAHTEQWTRNGMTRTIYFYDYGPYRIWGATARMLHSLLELLAA